MGASVEESLRKIQRKAENGRVKNFKRPSSKRRRSSKFQAPIPARGNYFGCCFIPPRWLSGFRFSGTGRLIQHLTYFYRRRRGRPRNKAFGLQEPVSRPDQIFSGAVALTQVYPEVKRILEVGIEAILSHSAMTLPSIVGIDDVGEHQSNRRSCMIAHGVQCSPVRWTPTALCNLDLPRRTGRGSLASAHLRRPARSPSRAGPVRSSAWLCRPAPDRRGRGKCKP